MTIIGLGIMGRALAGALLTAGHQVTVWNRTAAKAEEPLAHGALLADTATSAINASPVTITCVSDYQSLQQAFAPVADELDGRLLVNLTSGDSAQARDMARWAEQRGAHYLDGAIMAVPTTIGTAEAVILLSGSKTAFDRQQSVLDALGASTYLGEDHGLSALYDVAGLSMMWGVLNAWLHGVALLSIAGIDASTYTPFAVQLARGTVGWLAGYADQVDSGTYPPDDATLATHAGGMAHLVAESERLGVNAELPRLFKSLVDRAITAGQAGKSYPVLVEQFTQEPRTSTGNTDDTGDRVTDLLAAYISVWNERNPQTRQSIGAGVFTPDAYYADPNTSAQGRSAIDTYVAGWQEQFPDFVFVLGGVSSHHDVAHFGWSFGPPGGPPAATGGDVAVIEQGRISTIYGFFG